MATPRSPSDQFGSLHRRAIPMTLARKNNRVILQEFSQQKINKKKRRYG